LKAIRIRPGRENEEMFKKGKPGRLLQVLSAAHYIFSIALTLVSILLSNTLKNPAFKPPFSLKLLIEE
jgi:hypothetical protein